jgi:hypothetical protein
MMTENEIIDYIFIRFDNMFKENRFNDANNELIFNINLFSSIEMNTNILLALLTITLSAKDKLPNRKEFYDKVKEHLKDRDDVDSLLSGLE